jgi:hypothetical protein
VVINRRRALKLTHKSKRNETVGSSEAKLVLKKYSTKLRDHEY